MNTIKGWIPDFDKREFYFGEIQIEGQYLGRIRNIGGSNRKHGKNDLYILPGLVDAHVHIESSMLVPSAFAKQAVKYGTVATVSDPHEIANVLGKDGIAFMFEDAEKVPLKIYFTAPSCVPATEFEESGAILEAEELKELAIRFNFIALGEMMNFPGVISGEKKVKDKIELFRLLKLPIDGHAPGVRGRDLDKYADSGISTDHESTNLEEAKEKIGRGIKILIREGSAARNFDALWTLIKSNNEDVMLCCDDIHPDELQKRHIDKLIVRGMKKGLNIFDLLKAASINPIKHYNLDVGMLQKGDKADFILVDDLEEFRVRETFINGKSVSEKGQIKFDAERTTTPNLFNRSYVKADDFEMKGNAGRYRVIEVIDGDLFTKSGIHYLDSMNGLVMPDNEQDIVRIAVVNRYRNTPPALGWIKKTGLKTGAIASSVAHDSHNIIVTGKSPEDMAKAVNLIVENQGGISCSGKNGEDVLPLPVAGLMSQENVKSVGEKYEELNKTAKHFGSKLQAPYMTLSFMALLVIPELKIGDRGLFDAKEFKFVEPMAE